MKNDAIQRAQEAVDQASKVIADEIRAARAAKDEPMWRDLVNAQLGLSKAKESLIYAGNRVNKQQ